MRRPIIRLMPVSLEGQLVVAISSRALFDFEERGFDTTVEPGKFVAVALRVDEFLIMAGRSGDVRGGVPGPVYRWRRH